MINSNSKYNPNKFCLFLYDSAILFFIFISCLCYYHHFTAYHHNILQTLDSSHVLVANPAQAFIKTGDSFPVFRFQESWRSPLGTITIEEAGSDLIKARYNGADFKWPMGRHGTIISRDGTKVTINIGSSLALNVGDALIVFRDRYKIGKISLVDVRYNSSDGVISEEIEPILNGSTVSEYTVATQVYLDNPSYRSSFDLIAIILFGIAYLSFWIFKRTSPILTFGSYLQKKITLRQKKSLAFLFDIAASGLIIWLATSISMLCLANYGRMLGANDIILSVFELGAQYSNYLSLVIYCFFVFVSYTRKQSLLQTLHKLCSFQGGTTKFLSPLYRDKIIWMMHLLVAGAFASSLFYFLKGNLNAALLLAWPDCPYSINGSASLLSPKSLITYLETLFKVLFYMVSHLPHFQSTDGFFITARYLLWSLTILGCILGYGHSILGYIWGIKIRNLDFTIVGWVVNAWCYGPLIGWAIWKSVPSVFGLDPIFYGETITLSNLAMEFYLNVLYTLTIFNLGKKFGVMTDKGVVKNHFYSVVRHPSYTLEALMFIMLEMKGLSTIVNWLSISMYLVIYIIRSERDDDFMSGSNPEYVQYKQLTPWKFLPGIY